MASFQRYRESYPGVGMYKLQWLTSSLDFHMDEFLFGFGLQADITQSGGSIYSVNSIHLRSYCRSW
jgi:hypothetical protein